VNIRDQNKNISEHFIRIKKKRYFLNKSRICSMSIGYSSCAVESMMYLSSSSERFISGCCGISLVNSRGFESQAESLSPVL
jgi:hypothetical protein